MHRELQDDERKAFEGYLLANGDPALIQKALTNLVPGSVPHNYLYFVNLLSKAQQSLTGADVELLNKFVTSNKHKNTFEARQLKLWNMLRRFDSDVEARSVIIDELCLMLRYSFDDQKPQLREGIRNDESSENEDEQRHTLQPIVVSNESIVAKKQAKLDLRIAELDKQSHQPQVKTQQAQNLTKLFLEKIAMRGDGIWHQLDFEKYDAIAVYQAALSKWDLLRTFQNESLFKQIVKGLANTRAEDAYFTLQPHFVKAFTIQQLDKLKQLDPWFQTEDNFIGAYFQKQFCEELSLENQEAWSLQEKFKNLERLYNLAKSQNLPKSFQKEFLNDLLQLGPKIGIYSKQHFKDFIDFMPKHEMHYFLGYEMAALERSTQQLSKQKVATNWGQYLSNVKQHDRSSAHDQIQEYLNEFCEQAKGSLAEFAKDFKPDFLKEFERKWQVYLSREGMNSLDQDLISLEYYKQMADEVQLQFNKQNQELFKVEEMVSLEVIIKNIKVLFVKVFEFNTETYYKKELQPFNTGVNLDGLDAKISQEFTYELAGNIRHRETFQFPQLNNRVGLFIVEFMGNGVSARAVIKKGSLSLVHRSTIAGHLAYVLDENKKVCIGQKTGVWFDQKYYPADKDTGRIFIPYSKQETSQKIIMINGDFAQLSEFCRKTESYEFGAQFYLHSGSVLVGASTSVVIKASLNINGRRAQLNLLKNVKLVLTTYNYIDNLPVTKTFSNLQFTNDKELLVTFQVPPNLKHIDVNLTCELLNATTKQTEKFNSSHQFGVVSNNNLSDNVMFMPYLKKTNSQYEVSLLGRNGEPAAKKKVTVVLKHRLRPERPYTQNLITNSQGVCKLGSLQQIQEVTVFAEANQHESRGNWLLQYGTGASFWSYPQCQFEVLEGDSVELPIIMQEGQAKLDRKYLSVTRSNDGLIIDDWFDKVQLMQSGDPLFGYHYLKIDDLAQGEYQLKYVSGHEEKYFYIKVTKGETWGQEGGFILKKNCLQENVQSTSICKISAVSISQGQEATVKVNVENCSGNVRLHAFAHQYLPKQQTEFAQQIQTLQTQKISTSSFPFAKWTNIYQSNRQMADEIRYVFDRKQLEGQLGNTLDRPTLLNKRNFVQNTTTEVEALRGGDPFANLDCEPMYAQQSYNFGMEYQNCAPQAFNVVQNCAPMAYQSQMIQPQARQMMANRAYHTSTTTSSLRPIDSTLNVHSEFHSFMKQSPLQKLNMTPQMAEGSEAQFEFTCDLTQFSQLVIIAVDKDSLTQKSIDIDALVAQKRDLRLLQAPEQDQGLTESRSTIEILAKGHNFIEDISSTDITLVDDLTKVYEILSEIRKVQCVNSSGFQSFDFVLRWHTYSTSEKDRYYSDYCCNELNLFILKKDPAYFKLTVKPFIQTKMEKQFFDFYLLGLTKECAKFQELHLLQTLNILELCFLIDVLAKEGQQGKAVAMAKNMQLEQIANSKSDQDSVNYKDKIFDLVLNLNSLNQNKDAFGSLKKAKAEEPKTLKLAMAPMAPGGPPPPGNPMAERYCAAPPMRARGAPMMKSRVQERESNVNLFDDSSIQEQRGHMMKKQNFEELEATSEYMETHYFELTNNQSSKSIVRPSQFWCDYAIALAEGKKHFLSSNFTDSSQSDRESFLAICVTDLPMEATEPHEFVPNEKRGVTIKAASNLLLFKKEIKACDVDLSRNDIMVIHRYNEINSQGDQPGKPEEFLARTGYACEVVITNVAPKVKSFNLLYQVPEGSIPLKQTKYMKSQYVSLQPYRSLKVVFHFYFPQAGQFKHFPSNISVNGVVTARGGANDMTVVDSKRISKIESFDDILHAGSKQDVLNFIKTENLYNSKMNFAFSKMLYLLKDREFFTEAVQILRERCHFDEQVWRYSLFHKDKDLMREYFMMDEHAGLVPILGAHFDCGLITVDESTSGNQGLTKHLEYHPMVNSRTHLLGQSHKIMNGTFRRTYDKFLMTQIQKAQRSIEDQLVFVYYLQLQDRTQEAISLFKSITPPNEHNGTLRIQYDYLQAYFDFFSGTDDGFKTARRIVQKYDNYPVTSWRMMFLTIADQLNEFDGEFDNEEEMLAVDAGVSAQDALIREKRAQNKKDAKKREPQMQVEVDSQGTLKVESCNVTAVCVQYYIINAELLFSRQPFLKDNTEGFSFVKAYHTLEHSMHNAQVSEEVLNQYVKADIKIPDKLVNQNMVIEITSGDLQKFLTYYSNELKINILEQYGELKVTHAVSGKALPMTYVKVFYQKKSNNEATFYRDGYTDIRGKIEYAQTSGDKLKDVKKFAIFVQNDKYGSKIMECDPPKEASGNGQVVTMQAQKMQRLQHRQEYANVNSKVKSKH